MPNLKHIWQRSFLYKLKQQNKLLLFVVVGWLVINLLTSVFGHQTTPFYQWAMYAPPVIEKNEYSVTEVYNTNKSRLISDPHTWNDFRTLMVRYPLDNFLKLSDSNYRQPDFATIKKIASKLHVKISPLLTKIDPGVDSAKAIEFYNWCTNYVCSTGDIDCYNIRIIEKTVGYDSSGRVHLVTTKYIHVNDQ